MDVNCMGVQWEFPSDIFTGEEFAEWLIEQAGTTGISLTTGTADRPRRLHVQRVNDYLAGIITVPKSSQMAASIEAGKLKFTLSEQTNLEFNVFVINLDNLRGLFMQYHGSMKRRSLETSMKRLFVKWRAEQVKVALATVPKAPGTRGYAIAVSRAKRPFATNRAFKQTAVATQVQLREALRRLKKIKRLSVVTMEEDVPDVPWAPMARKATKTRHLMTFAGGMDAQPWLSDLEDLAKYVGESDSVEATVHGEDAAGANDQIHLDDVVQCGAFETWEYDVMAADIGELDLEDFTGNWVIQRMIQICGREDLLKP